MFADAFIVFFINNKLSAIDLEQAHKHHAEEAAHNGAENEKPHKKSSLCGYYSARGGFLSAFSNAKAVLMQSVTSVVKGVFKPELRPVHPSCHVGDVVFFRRPVWCGLGVRAGNAVQSHRENVQFVRDLL